MDPLWNVLIILATALLGMAARWYWARSTAHVVDEDEVGAVFQERLRRYAEERERVLQDNPSELARLDRTLIAEFADEYRRLRAAAPGDERAALEFAFCARHQAVATHWALKDTARDDAPEVAASRAGLQQELDKYRDDLAWVSRYLPDGHEFRVDPAPSA